MALWGRYVIFNYMKNKKIKAEIQKGSIVSIKNGYGGYYKITSLKDGKVNLGSIIRKEILHKGVPIENIYENGKEWSKKWSKNNTSMCM